MAAPAAPADFDLFLPLRSAGAMQSPYPVYSLLRSVRPVLALPVEGYTGPGIWMLTRYADVNTALRDARFSADRLRAHIFSENLDRLPAFLRQQGTMRRSMLVMDPPDHTRVRRLVSKAFTPRRIAKLEGRIESIVNELLDGAEARGTMELMSDFAAPLPAIVIAELLGVPPEDQGQFREWSTALIAGLGGRSFSQAAPASEAALSHLFAYLEGVIAQRRREPRDDLISALVLAQEEDDTLSDAELLATSNLLLLAGHETTTNLIGNGVLALLRDREAFESLRESPALLPNGIEELLRYDGPVQGTVRVVLEDVELAGQEIPAGALVFVSIGAANHDPDVFEHPERLDVGRDPNPHLAFGVGTHFCLGSALARLEARVAFGGLLDRFPNMQLATETPEYRSNPILRGLTSLPLQL